MVNGYTPALFAAIPEIPDSARMVAVVELIPLVSHLTPRLSPPLIVKLLIGRDPLTMNLMELFVTCWLAGYSITCSSLMSRPFVVTPILKGFVFLRFDSSDSTVLRRVSFP